MENFTSHSEYHFSKNLTPRLLKVDKTYKVNRVKLMRDIRMLRKFCDGKIPEVTSDDAAQSTYRGLTQHCFLIPTFFQASFSKW